MLELRRSLRAEDGDPETAMQGMETAARLSSALTDLGPKDRLLAELHLIRGQSLDDVADVLGVSMNAAYVRKSRVLERLRRMLGSEE
jgi:RNA polymerase sigma factor (sigma-70 family)